MRFTKTINKVKLDFSGKFSIGGEELLKEVEEETMPVKEPLLMAPNN